MGEHARPASSADTSLRLGPAIGPGAYGVRHHAEWPLGREVDALIVTDALASDAGFLAALSERDWIDRVVKLRHARITPTLGITSDADRAIVLTAPASRRISLAELWRRAPLSREVAAAITVAIAEALAAAHQAGVVLGVLDPRSVMIDGRGAVQLTDVMVSRPLALAASGGRAPTETAAVAPEIKSGSKPSRGADVYALGVLWFTSVSGNAPPGTLGTTPAVERWTQRALSPDRGYRFVDGNAALGALREALEDDGWVQAERAEIAAATGLPRAGSEADADELLASLGDLGDGDDDAAPNRLSGLLDELDQDPAEPPRVPTGARPLSGPDVVPAAVTAPVLAHPGTHAAVRAKTPLPIAARQALAAANATNATTAAPRGLPANLEVEAPVPSIKRGLPWLWILIIVAGVAGGVALIVKQRKAAERDDQEQAAIAAHNAEVEARLKSAAPRPGVVRIHSEPSGAGVWMLVGRTPVDSLPLSSGIMHEVRLELDGYQSVDAQVLPMHWSGTGDARVAQLATPLVQGQNALPAVPPTPRQVEGFVTGRGPIHFTSEPPGAAVWMFVGQTDNVEVRGLQAGRDYQFRVMKDQFQTRYVGISADEWRDGGDPNLPIAAAKLRDTMERTAVLDPAEPAPIKKPKGGR